jgi:hypothetical protein
MVNRIPGEAVYYDEGGKPHDCFHLCSAPAITKAFAEDLPEDRIRQIVDDIFEQKPTGFHYINKIAPWIGEEGLSAISFVVFRNHDLPSYALDAIANRFYETLFECNFETSLIFKEWKQLIKQPRFSGESLMQQIYALNERFNLEVERTTNVFRALMIELILDHPNVTPDIFMELCSSPDVIIRYLCTRHPRCPEEAKVASVLLGTTETNYRRAIGIE